MIWTVRLIGAVFCSCAFGSIAFLGWDFAAARHVTAGAFVLIQPVMLAIRARK